MPEDPLPADLASVRDQVIGVSNCLAGLRLVLSRTSAPPGSDEVQIFKECLAALTKSVDELEAALTPVEHELAKAAGRKVQVCGISGVCTARAILKLAQLVISRFKAASGKKYGSLGRDVIEAQWEYLQSEVKHIKGGSLGDAVEETRRECFDAWGSRVGVAGASVREAADRQTLQAAPVADGAGEGDQHREPTDKDSAADDVRDKAAVVDDPITLADAAALLLVEVKTVYNRGTENRPEPAIPKGKNRRAIWSYRRLRPWLLREFPDSGDRLPEDYDEVRKLLSGPKCPSGKSSI